MEKERVELEKRGGRERRRTRTTGGVGFVLM